MLWMWLGLLIGLPLILVGWLAFDRKSDRASALLLAVAAGAYLVAIALAGLWLVVPRPALLVLAALFAVAVIARMARHTSLTMLPRHWRPMLGLAGRAALSVVAVGLVARAAWGRRAPDAAIELRFPLQRGIYVVANGGSNDLVNTHLMTLSNPAFGDFRGQSYGVDLIEVDGWGIRAKYAQPPGPADYRIFGDSVYAPCEGTVVIAVDGLPDMPPPLHDREHLAGNHVVIDCAGVWVVLAHFKQGSVVVSEGEGVVGGKRLALVGNSGNSDEPHLHVHAQMPGTGAAPLSGEPLAIRFEGRFLSRNQRVIRP